MTEVGRFNNPMYSTRGTVSSMVREMKMLSGFKPVSSYPNPSPSHSLRKTRRTVDCYGCKIVSYVRSSVSLDEDSF